MARKQKHNLDEVLRALAKKNDVRIDERLKVIYVLTPDAKKAKNDLGNGSWGKIDYLIKVHSYDFFRVNEF